MSDNKNYFKLSVFAASMLFLYSCKNDNKCFKIEGKTIYIDCDKKINKIVFKSNKTKKQEVKINTKSNSIELIRNYRINLDNEDVLNTWYSFDSEGNFYEDDSYYFGAFPEKSDSGVFLYVLYNFCRENDNCYILYNENCKDPFLDEVKTKFDTIRFNNNYFAAIPIGKYDFGLNKVKFILVNENSINGQKAKRKIYGEKEIVIKKNN